MQLEYSTLIEAALGDAKRKLDLQGTDLKVPDFDIRGELYRLALEMAPTARQEELDCLLTVLNAQHGEVGVDLAAGTGFLTTHLLARTQNKIYAIDPSKTQLENIPTERPHLTRLCLSPDGEKILDVIPDGSVDFVTSLGGLHHISNQALLFKNVARMLKPGGRFVAADVCAGTPLSRHFDQVVANKCITGHTANWLDHQKVRDFAQRNSLTLVRCESITPHWRFTSDEEMALYFKALHAYDIPLAEVEADVRMELGVYTYAGNVYVNWPLLIFDLRA